MPTYDTFIEKLEHDECFVFTSNKSGFHGAGSAGFATFNIHGNVWRDYDYDKWEDGTKGKWNIKGQSEGFQVGTIGCSYAIPSVTQPGRKRSISLRNIKSSVNDFYDFARNCNEMKFFVAQDIKEGYNGYLPEEMVRVWKSDKIPENVYFYAPFYAMMEPEDDVWEVFLQSPS